MRIALVLVFAVACKSGSHDTASATASGSAPVTGSGSGSASVAPPPTPAAPVAPVAKPTRVEGVGGGHKSFDITLPPDVKMTIDEGGEETLPSARFEGGGLSFVVESPEYWPEVGWTLAEEKGVIDRSPTKVTFERTDDRGDTWTMIYKHPPEAGGPAGYTVDVAFRTANLMCRAQTADTRANADRIAAICETVKIVDAPKTKH